MSYEPSRLLGEDAENAARKELAWPRRDLADEQAASRRHAEALKEALGWAGPLDEPLMVAEVARLRRDLEAAQREVERLRTLPVDLLENPRVRGLLAQSARDQDALLDENAALRQRLAAAQAALRQAKLPRNTRWEIGKVLVGEWVCVPAEDFEELRAALAPPPPSPSGSEGEDEADAARIRRLPPVVPPSGGAA